MPPPGTAPKRKNALASKLKKKDKENDKDDDIIVRLSSIADRLMSKLPNNGHVGGG